MTIEALYEFQQRRQRQEKQILQEIKNGKSCRYLKLDEIIISYNEFIQQRKNLHSLYTEAQLSKMNVIQELYNHFGFSYGLIESKPGYSSGIPIFSSYIELELSGTVNNVSIVQKDWVRKSLLSKRIEKIEYPLIDLKLNTESIPPDYSFFYINLSRIPLSHDDVGFAMTINKGEHLLITAYANIYQSYDVDLYDGPKWDIHFFTTPKACLV